MCRRRISVMLAMVATSVVLARGETAPAASRVYAFFCHCCCHCCSGCFGRQRQTRVLSEGRIGSFNGARRRNLGAALRPKVPLVAKPFLPLSDLHPAQSTLSIARTTSLSGRLGGRMRRRAGVAASMARVAPPMALFHLCRHHRTTAMPAVQTG